MTTKQLQTQKIDPKVKDVLMMIGAGLFLTGSFLMPGLPILAKSYLKEKNKKENDEWKKFNTWRLKQIIKRLHTQKLVEIAENKNGYAVLITGKGKQRLLKYDLEDMTLAKKKLGWKMANCNLRCY